MSRVEILITIKLKELEYLEEYLLKTIGKRFNSEFRIIHTDYEKNYMNVGIDLENGSAAYLLGCAEHTNPISSFVEKKLKSK